MEITRRIAASTFLAAALCSPLVYAEIVDNGTERQNMLACPEGMYMTGIHADDERVLCEWFGNPYDAEDERVDWDTIEAHMHACPRGWAMTGFHASANLLLCAPLSKPSNYRIVDRDVIRAEMKACPPTYYVVVGIHLGANALLCEYQPDGPVPHP